MWNYVMMKATEGTRFYLLIILGVIEQSNDIASIFQQIDQIFDVLIVEQLLRTVAVYEYFPCGIKKHSEVYFNHQETCMIELILSRIFFVL